MVMRVAANRETCVVSSLCVYRAPTVFAQDDDLGQVVVLDEEPGDELHAAVRRAARGCPTKSIKVTEPDGSTVASAFDFD
ncbi:ferredoxin [Kutzneria chonburiensis]|jgi:ferredoxin|uniref:Ferredoxin n=1 Tax=Kutzneria chonburiensis TaxID=1483604 RepID=A0ABV6MRF9_9PSEU|nr:ferredoxin [Kutzneria chonburiensis]HTI20730.1 ferredoxin [Kutzneria sp.]